MTINGSGSVVKEDGRLLELAVMRYIVFESRRSEKKGQVVDKEQLSWHCVKLLYRVTYMME